MKRKSDWLDAHDATAALGVSAATLYAYVSRGRVRSETVPGSARRRRYSREDIERLKLRAERRRDPDKAAEQSLRWGLPILESAITLIVDGRLYYRGRDVAELARSHSVAQVAGLLWTGAADAGVFTPSARLPALARGTAGLPFMSRVQSLLPIAAAHDALAYDLRPRAVAQTGWRVLELMTGVAAGRAARGATIDAALAAAWGVPRRAPLLRSALILCADHELNVSAFTARCIASAGSSPYAVVLGGLAALEGTKHGGATARVAALCDALRKSTDLRGALADRLRRGEPIEGFGHPLYANGDPRAAMLLEALPDTAETRFAHAFAAAAESVLGEAPTIDFGLVALGRALKLPGDAALTLFAIGRTIGWIAHAIEQYAHAAIIRPRAKYVGERPG